MARVGNYPAQQNPSVTSEELSAKISFMQHLARWEFTTDPDKVGARVDWFFSQCATYGVRPTVAGLAAALNTSRQTLWVWQQKGGKLGEIIDQAKRVLNALLEDWGVNGKINPIVLVWAQKNHFGYKDATTIQVTDGAAHQLRPQLTPAEIAKRIEQDIPVDDIETDIIDT